MAVLAAFGERFSQLAALDEDWCRRKVPSIFNSDSTGSDPAWATFLEYGRLDLRTFQLLRQRYAKAVAELATFDRQLGEHLGIHLAILYWHDQIAFGDEPALLETFFEGAPASMAAAALEHIGHMLHETAPTPTVLARLRSLWTRRVGVGRPEELAAFGWWFSSKRLDDEWALAQLHKVLVAQVLPVDAQEVAEQVAWMSRHHLSEALSILDLVQQANTQAWGLFGWRRPAKSIVEAGISSPDLEHQRRARGIASRFCSPSYGYLEFRRLADPEVDGTSPPGEAPQS